MPEPKGGWYIQAGSAGTDGEIEIEAYCSKGCFTAHEDQTCGCFEQEDEDLYAEEEWY